MDRNRIIVKEYDWDALVALRKESVDRNMLLLVPVLVPSWSLSARRAWIEMENLFCRALQKKRVALRKESVDRNMGVGTTRDSRGGRSPQGERG